jgi:hypothetical protein
VNSWKTLLIFCSLVFLLVGCDSDSKNKNDSPAVAGEGGSKPSGGGGAECTGCKSESDCGQGMECLPFEDGSGSVCALPETVECSAEGDSSGGGSGRECDFCSAQGDCGGGMTCTPFEDGSGSVCALPETVECPGEEGGGSGGSGGSGVPDRDPPLNFPGPSGVLGPDGNF